MVIQELDYFKDGRAGSRSLQELANKAVKFINEQLTSTSSNLIGQTVQDALKDKFLSSNSDDGILNCCLQLKERGHDCVCFYFLFFFISFIFIYCECKYCAAYYTLMLYFLLY